MRLEDVRSFTYLGIIVTPDGGADEDVKTRIGKARQTFNTLRPVWNSTSISIKTSLHHQCKVGSSIRFRDLESHKIHIKQAANIHYLMSEKDPKDILARENQQEETLDKNRVSRDR